MKRLRGQKQKNTTCCSKEMEEESTNMILNRLIPGKGLRKKPSNFICTNITMAFTLSEIIRRKQKQDILNALQIGGSLTINPTNRRRKLSRKSSG